MASSRSDETVWERGWDGHEVLQLQRLARLSLADKLKWLEEAQQVVGELSRKKAGSAPSSDR